MNEVLGAWRDIVDQKLAREQRDLKLAKIAAEAERRADATVKDDTEDARRLWNEHFHYWCDTLAQEQGLRTMTWQAACA